MAKVFRSFRRFLQSEDGTSEVEYAVMLMLIVLVCVSAIQAVGEQNSAMYESIEEGVSSIREKAEGSNVQ